jgi:hypothetical protein
MGGASDSLVLSKQAKSSIPPSVPLGISRSRKNSGKFHQPGPKLKQKTARQDLRKISSESGSITKPGSIGLSVSGELHGRSTSGEAAVSTAALYIPVSA